MEPPNNGQVGDGHFVHYSEVVPSSEVPPPSALKLLSHFKNDIAYTLSGKVQRNTLSTDKPISIASFTCPRDSSMNC